MVKMFGAFAVVSRAARVGLKLFQAKPGVRTFEQPEVVNPIKRDGNIVERPSQSEFSV